MRYLFVLFVTLLSFPHSASAEFLKAGDRSTLSEQFHTVYESGQRSLRFQRSPGGGNRTAVLSTGTMMCLTADDVAKELRGDGGAFCGPTRGPITAHPTRIGTLPDLPHFVIVRFTFNMARDPNVPREDLEQVVRFGFIDKREQPEP